MQHGRPELLAASDEIIDDAIRYADPLALRGVLYQLTGDEELLDIGLTTVVVGGFREMRMVADKGDVARIRAKAAAFLKSYRDAGAGPLPIGPAERRQLSMSLAVGFDVASSDLEMWLEELAVDPWARGFSWSAEAAPARVADFSVAVIGAGMGGSERSRPSQARRYSFYGVGEELQCGWDVVRESLPRRPS